MREQLERLEHAIFAGFTHEPAVKLAEELMRMTPAGLNRCFFADNGSAAIEVAVKMSFHYWRNTGQQRKTRFITLANSYHGETLGALAVGNVELYKSIYQPLLMDVITVPSPDAFVREPGVDAAEHARRMFAHMEAALAQNHGEVAAVIVEPLVQCAGGMRMYDPVYLKLLREACDRYGVHLIADEIAVGFGRTGTMFACEQAGIRPDYLCLSKGLTGGYLPLSVVLTTDAIYDAFYDEYAKLNAFLHSHSYTGNPLACAAANATLAIFRDEPVIERNRATAAHMLAAVRAPARSPARGRDPPVRHDPRHRAREGPRHAHALALGGTARPAHLPACARTRRADSPARHHDLLHAALRHRARRDRLACPASPPKASNSHARDAHLRRAEARLRQGSRAARAGGPAPHARAAPRGRRCRHALRRHAAANTPARSSATARKLWARVGAHSAIERESPLQVTLLQGVARGERMDLIVQKATELGVTRIVPVLAERSVVKVDASKSARKLEHWQSIAISACEQCGRNRVPEVSRADRAGRRRACARARASRATCSPRTRAIRWPRRCSADAGRPVVLLIGPEGGLADTEREFAGANGFTACAMGPRILRTETAGLAALAVTADRRGGFPLTWT